MWVVVVKICPLGYLNRLRDYDKNYEKVPFMEVFCTSGYP